MLKPPKKILVLAVTGLVGIGLIATPVLARSASNPPAPVEQKIETAVNGLVQQGTINDGQGKAVIGAISDALNSLAAGKGDQKAQGEGHGKGGFLQRFRNHAQPKKAAGAGILVQEREKLLAGVAKSIGITPKDLAKEIKSGKSLQTIIEEHGKTVDQVTADLISQLKTRLDKAVENKNITQAQEDRILGDVGAILPKVIDLQDVRNDIRQEHPNLKRLEQVGPALLVNGIAQNLGLQPRDVKSELQAGKTLKQVIEEHGSTVDKVVDAVSAKLKTALDQAVANEKITQAQADKILARFKAHVTKAIENQHPNAKGMAHKPMPPRAPAAARAHTA